jgi:uracil-DNA glycosylase family 4
MLDGFSLQRKREKTIPRMVKNPKEISHLYVFLYCSLPPEKLKSYMNRREHSERWSHCKLCPDMCGNVPRIVILRQSQSVVFKEQMKRVLWLGEAPGISEADLGKPFIGPSGQLLRAIIHEVSSDLPPFQSYLQNVIACRPFDNRTPTKLEITTCRHRLFECLSIIDPHIIVTVGATSKQVIADLLAMKLIPDKIPHIPVHLLRKAENIVRRPSLHMMHPASMLRMPATRQHFIRRTTCVDLIAGLNPLLSQN